MYLYDLINLKSWSSLQAYSIGGVNFYYQAYNLLFLNKDIFYLYSYILLIRNKNI